MIKRWYSRTVSWIVWFVSFGILTTLVLHAYIWSVGLSWGRWYTVSTLPHRSVGIVLGAGILGNRIPSAVLADRLNGAIRAYRRGVVSRLLLSGDGTNTSHSETLVMRNYLIERGIPETTLIIDPEGIDTYTSLFRAYGVWGVRDAVIFTQVFHMGRSLYIARRLGIDAVGGLSDAQSYRYERLWAVREYFAAIKALFDVEIRPYISLNL